ncbi:hypothetical protein [Actinomadura sp. 3N407]|uniref:hypothetical protein n=1 Tax=Actinomadura sp. 3N407 TaxID=3457423 RepID=UPI003FCDAA42
MLAFFGAGSFAGVTIGGRTAGAHPAALVVTGMTALAAGRTALTLTAGTRRR